MPCLRPTFILRGLSAPSERRPFTYAVAVVLARCCCFCLPCQLCRIPYCLSPFPASLGASPIAPPSPQQLNCSSSQGTLMLVVMQAHATEEQVRAVCEKIESLGFRAHAMPGAQRTAIGVTGNAGIVEAPSIE